MGTPISNRKNLRELVVPQGHTRIVLTVLITMVLAVVVDEGYFLFKYYDRYYGSDASTVTGSTPTEATGRNASSSGNADPDGHPSDGRPLKGTRSSMLVGAGT